MRLRQWFTWALAALLCAASLAALAQQREPSPDQIYQAASAGRLAEARRMADQVVQGHPDSAKAHYVRAEVEARQGDTDLARQDLSTAERLAPGLPFAKPEAVSSLRRELDRPAGATQRMGAAPGEPVPTERAAPKVPWSSLLVGLALVIGIAMLLRRRSTAMGWGGPGSPTAGPVVSSGGMPAPGAQPGGYGYGPAGYPPGTTVGGGLGSGIGRGLATGAALGAGALAAEEIGRHFLHGREGQVPYDPAIDSGVPGDASRFDGNPNADMGGQDFGLQDGSGWDDAGSADTGDFDPGGSSDWDS